MSNFNAQICQLDILSARDCAVAACRHAFHRDCISEYLEEQKGGVDESNSKKANNNNKKKGGAAAPKKGGKKGNASGAADATAGSGDVTCPCCYQPLTLTMDIRGANDDSSDDDDNDDDDDDDDDDGNDDVM